MCICAVLSFASCDQFVDKDFDIADVSGEVTVGGEELIVPLAEIPAIHLSDLIKDNEYLNSNGEDGTYQISYTSYGDDPKKYESIKIDGISIPNITGLSPKLDPIGFSFQQLPTTLSMAGISSTFEVDYPTISNIMTIEPIKMEQGLDLSLPISGQGAITEQALNFLKMQGLDTVNSSYGSEIAFNAEIEVLEQLKKIDWVEFGCDKHPYGAPFEVKVDMQGLQDVVGGGSIKLNIEFPEGYYLRDENGKDFPAETHNILSREVALQAKQKKIEFIVYLNRIDYSDHETVNGKLTIDDYIKYSYDLSLNLGAGNYNLNLLPIITIEAAPEYKDVEVVINHFELPSVNYPINYAFNGMPNGVSVEKVAFKNTYLTVSLKGLEWLKIQDNKTDEDLPIEMKVKMPECMNFEQSTYYSNHTISATAVELAKGLRLKLNDIDCKANGVKQENGQLVINSNISAEIDLHSMDNHTVLISSLTAPQKPVVVSVAIADTTLNLDTENTKVTWSGDQSYDFDLGSNIPTISQTVEVPEMIASIQEIEIGNANKAGEPVKIAFEFASAKAFPVNEIEVDVAINLGKMLRPTQSTLNSGIIKQSDNGDYILAIKETWKPNEAPLAKEVAFEALQNIEVKNGKVVINQSFPVTGCVKIKDGQNIDLSKVDSAKINIDVAIDDIEIRTFTGGIDLSLEPEPMAVELGDFSNLGIDIKHLSLNPIIDIKLKDNPTNIPLSGDFTIKALNSKGQITSTLTVPTINIAASGPTHLVLSTPRHAAQFEGVEGVTFVVIDGLEDVLSNGIPSKISVDMDVRTDKNDIRTIDLAKAKSGYDIQYQYSLVMPLVFDDKTDISYASSISGLNNIFAELADVTKGLKVGDVGLIAEFGTTIPFNIVISAELINAQGTTDGVEAKLNINECVIKGYTNEKECGEKSISEVDLDFDLGDSHSLEGLRNADGVRFKFTIYSTGEEGALKSSQFVDGTLKLRLREGVLIDVFDFLIGLSNE